MSSFAEAKGLEYLKQDAIAFVNYNKRQMSRIYPKGTRADSSNYMPQLYWNAGCQMVSLNFQTSDLPMQLNQGKFEFNGGCGYLLKPDFMRRAGVDFDPFSDTPIDGVIAQCVKVRVLAGSFLSDKKIGTYVEVDMFGLPSDTIKKEFRTRTVPANGLNPQYNEDAFVFRKVVLPNLAVLRFGVYDETDKLLGQRIIPLASLQMGYRHINLRTEASFPLSLPCLFCHIDVSIYVPDGFGDFMTALSDPGAFAKAATAQKAEMESLGIQQTSGGAAADALAGKKEEKKVYKPPNMDPVTIDMIKQSKSFSKFEKKNIKELDGIRKKATKERMALQKKDNAAIDKLIKGKSSADIKGNAELKKIVQEQNAVWAEMMARQRKEEYDLMKKHINDQTEQLKAQMAIVQAEQIKQMEAQQAKDTKDMNADNLKSNLDLAKEVEADATLKTKGDKERRLREKKANALKRFMEEKKTFDMKYNRAMEKLKKGHEKQLADFSVDLKKVLDTYTADEEEYKSCGKNEFFV
jgi:phosphatidylinositol phospholipase C, beta